MLKLLWTFFSTITVYESGRWPWIGDPWSSIFLFEKYIKCRTYYWYPEDARYRP